ncbi:phospholipid transporting ATPase [Pichia californica]|uniref:Phospholipid-transporting ATPase n=1 Tax=Pichia californica TaxID=460514 RepID=A0A9P6WQX1_9ASCO|nr:phospholipid transporting ATPase [[Candida] californica]KAG0690772.1 phospholipid transporting ATPase [[Candida] californica]
MSGQNGNGYNSPFDDKYVFQDADGNQLPSPSMGYKSNLNNNNNNKRHFSGYSTSSSKAGDDDFEDANSIGKTPMILQDSSALSNNRSSSLTAPNLYGQLNLKSSNINNDKIDFDEVEESFDDLGELNSDFKNNFNKTDNDLKRGKTTFERHRWGTQRKKDGRPLTRNKTLKKVLESSLPPQFFPKQDDDDDDEHLFDNSNKDEKDLSHKKREIYWNLPLPATVLDDEGKPQKYSRNKIRTTKYTPITFIPKNLYYQFGNVANIYFLAMNILGAFEIFGVPNPALSSVPLIVIIVITAFKDALEDSRRTVLDLEVNNQITHVLKGMDNPNFNGENISLWRQLKKATTRLMMAIFRAIKNQKLVDPLAEDPAYPKKSLDSIDYRRSLQQNRNNNNNINIQDTDDLNPFSDPITLEDNDQNDSNNVNDMLPFVSSFNDNYIAHPTFKKEYWKNIHVGDIVKIKNNDSIPVDIVILSTSDSDGACYVETKNLDGETNLKIKQALKCSHSDLISVDDLAKCKFWLESEGPKSNLYSYEGNLNYYANGDDERGEICNEPVNINNMLLRGCSLRNTKWVVGIVAFTGNDTKIMLNAGITPTKKSRIAKDLNWSVILNFILLFILCFVSAIVNGVYYDSSNVSRTYFEYGNAVGSAAVNGVVSFFVAVILYQSLVPISLYISVEIIKTAQAFFIYSDVKMYYEKLDYPCVPKSWNISDDLGQIEYIFSDKTGTLTQNIMEFKKCTINGVNYGRAYTEAYMEIRRRQGINVDEEAIAERNGIASDKIEMIKMLKEINKNAVSDTIEDDLTFISKKFAEDLKGKSGDIQKQADENFMLALSLCHSVLTERSEKDPSKFELRAQSPDEAALVGTARDVGFSFVNRTKNGLILNVQGDEKEYQILNILEFNSTRKRMSAIIKLPPVTPGGEPRALLICKGADSIIYSRLSDKNDKNLLETTAIHLEQFATEGLRTLCIAQKQLTWSQYQDWQKRHKAASSSLQNREDKMEEVASSIERDLMLLGGTAIEDRLQDGVPDCIQLLARAGIKLWVLTGDKVETAINIGFSCNLLENTMQLLVIKTSGEDVEKIVPDDMKDEVLSDKSEMVKFLLEKYLEDYFDMLGSAEELEKEKKIHEPPSGNFGVVIDGDALKLALGDSLRIKFLLLCKQCKAVLCCRVSPAQKAAVVKLVKETLDVMTLAIGDGSNDVAMIQAANVGVGIAGEEGTQAVMSSDYAVGQFRYLARLVLVHGRWSYKRLAEMIPCFFYKNVIFALALFWYGIYDNFDGTYLFEYTYLMFYNLAFTSLPVIFLGIFDQDVDDYISLLVPQLYRTGILRTEWNVEKFYWYMVDGFYQSIISFFYPYFLYYKNGIVSNIGLQLDHRFYFGAIVASIAIVSCNTYIMLRQNRWDWLSCFINFISNILLFGWTGVWSSSTNSSEFYKVAARLYGAPSFWACFFIGVLMCMLPRFAYDFAVSVLYPKDIEIIRECVDRGDFKQYPRDYDPTDPNRPIISKYSQTHTLESHISPVDFPAPGPSYRDSINGTGGSRKNTFKRIFSGKSNTFSPSIPMNPSVESLATEEIEMDFQKGHINPDGSMTSPSFSVKNQQNIDDSFAKTKRSINLRDADDVEARGVSLENVRTSIDLPELTNARSLLSNLSDQL